MSKLVVLVLSLVVIGGPQEAGETVTSLGRGQSTPVVKPIISFKSIEPHYDVVGGLVGLERVSKPVVVVPVAAPVEQKKVVPNTPPEQNLSFQQKVAFYAGKVGLTNWYIGSPTGSWGSTGFPLCDVAISTRTPDYALWGVIAHERAHQRGCQRFGGSWDKFRNYYGSHANSECVADVVAKRKGGWTGYGCGYSAQFERWADEVM